MARAGRKRKVGPRTPSGELKRAPRAERDPRLVVVAQRAASGVRPEDVLDQRAGYPLGRLCLAGLITDDQLEAGRRYATAQIRWQRLNGTPRHNPGAVDWDAVRGVDSREPDPDQARRALLEAVEADAALKAAGRSARLLVWSCVMLDAETHPSGLADLRLGLDGLVRHFGL